MSFSQGMALSYSWKQKINTKSSTEAELVGVDNLLGYILWACYFMIEQGYDMDPSLLYQDNMSAVLLETNGYGASLGGPLCDTYKMYHESETAQKAQTT